MPNNLNTSSQNRHKLFYTCNNNFGQRRMSMIESATTRVSTDRDDVEQQQQSVGALEQEALVADGLTRLNSNPVEATLNHLVCFYFFC